jgi:cytochrome bd-type quinol oxidase subunit 1
MRDYSALAQLGFDRWTVIFGLGFVLLLLALRSVWRSKVHSRKAKVFWTIVCLLPLVGPAAWFVTGIQRQRHQ